MLYVACNCPANFLFFILLLILTYICIYILWFAALNFLRYVLLLGWWYFSLLIMAAWRLQIGVIIQWICLQYPMLAEVLEGETVLESYSHNVLSFTIVCNVLVPPFLAMVVCDL